MDIDTQTKQGPVKREAEIGMMPSNAKQPPKAGRGKKFASQNLQREYSPANTLISDF